ncbi:hypothetical protein DFH94DRAFT_619600, partial [Russula ochroleuca]
HWAIPRPIWKEMEALKNGKRLGRQTNLNGIVQKVTGPGEFTRTALQHAVTQFIACDDQSLAVANKATFCNCLVAMRPKTIKADLPTTYNVMSHLHNEFVGWLQQLKADIEVLESI